MWGLKYAGRVVTAVIAGWSIFYLIDQWILHDPGHTGFGARRSDTTPLNATFAFITFGLPSLIYTLLGRLTIRAEPACPAVESLVLTLDLDDDKVGGSELRNRLRRLADEISNELCDGIHADYSGESENGEGKTSIEF